jgi:uncharacterized repeat protein (TIGR01451 family)
MTVRRTRRWVGVVPVALLAVTAGLLTRRPTVMLGALVALAFLVYPHLLATPRPELSVSRTLDARSARAGDRVEVTVTVRNEATTALPDLRIVDGVPENVPVVDGSARVATALAPGEAVTFHYVVRAVEGTRRFGPATVLARDRAGAREVEERVGPSTRLVGGLAARGGRTPASERPLGTGRGAAATGTGVRFERVREYRRGDPPSRIDWRRLARTGDRTTVEFADRRTESVMLVIDARPPAARAGADGLHAVGHAVAAAEGICRSVAAAGGRVGLTALGASDCEVPLGSGTAHRDRVLDTLQSHPALVSPAVDGEASATDLRRRVATTPRETRVVCLSPVLDDAVGDLLRRLRADGRTVTVVSPDVTEDGPLSVAMAALERAERLRRLRAAGVRVLDWSPGTPLGEAAGGGPSR